MFINTLVWMYGCTAPILVFLLCLAGLGGEVVGLFVVYSRQSDCNFLLKGMYTLWFLELFYCFNPI